MLLNMIKFLVFYIAWSLLKLWRRLNPFQYFNWKSDESEGWVRPLGKAEEILESAHQKGIMLSSYCLTLNSAKPLPIEDIKKSLLHLRRKIPTLQMCIRTKGSGKQMWFYKAEEDIIDFEELPKDANFDDAYFGMTVTKYDIEKGPLWRVKLLSEDKDAPCKMPELKHQFPHQNKIIFGFHHAITDGSSTMKIVSSFTDLLNDVIARKFIDDSAQLAYFADENNTVEMTMKAGLSMTLRPLQFKKYHDIATKAATKVLFLEAYPSPSNIKKQTLSLEFELGKEDTSKLIKKCRLEGVTLHSAFSTATNATFVDMLKKGGIDRETYLIPNFHLINVRRYWPGNEDYSKAFGPHIGQITKNTICPQNMMTNFWDHARTFNTALKIGLDDIAPLKQTIALFLSILSSKMDIDTFMKLPDRPEPYYITTNMGNLASILPGTGDHVQVSNIRRTTSSDGTNFSHVLQTFRGRLLMGLDYEASTVSKDTAQLHVDTLLKILRSIL